MILGWGSSPPQKDGTPGMSVVAIFSASPEGLPSLEAGGPAQQGRTMFRTAQLRGIKSG